MILVIFVLISCLFMYLSSRTSHASKPVNLWANDTTQIKVKDVQQYNQSCAKLLFGYAVLLIITGMIIQTQNIFMIIAGFLMTIFSSLLLMILYTLLEGKYRV